MSLPQPPVISIPENGIYFESNEEAAYLHKIMFKAQIPVFFAAVLAGLVTFGIGFVFIMSAVAFNYWYVRKKMASLKIVVDTQNLHLAYLVSHLKVSYLVNSIVTVELCELPKFAMTWRGSFPFRSVTGKKLYLWGYSRKGVSIQFNNGQELMVSSETPEELCAAINRARGVS